MKLSNYKKNNTIDLILNKINEEDEKPYLDNVDYKIDLTLKEILKLFIFWFKKGTISKYGYKIENITKDKQMMGLYNGFYFQFSNESENIYFSLYLMINSEWAMDDEIKHVYIELKRYNINTSKLEKTHMDNYEIEKLKEDWFISLINGMNDKAKDVTLINLDTIDGNEYNDINNTNLSLKDDFY